MATVRKNADKMTPAEAKAYTDGVTAMIADGSYGKLVDIHRDMSHHMHSHPQTDDPLPAMRGKLRFLPWHRAFLMEMEDQLQKKQKDAFIPYWNWLTGDIPAWIVAFKPNVKSGAGDIKNERNAKPVPDTKNPWPPKQKRCDELLAMTEYLNFSDQLERYPHNAGHNVLGPPMRFPMISPSDPIFFLHHGMVDRLWAMWQEKNPGKDPIIAASDKDYKMDPWDSKWDVAKLRSIKSLGYSYGPV
jgi:tyrosinase